MVDDEIVKEWIEKADEDFEFAFQKLLHLMTWKRNVNF